MRYRLSHVEAGDLIVDALRARHGNDVMGDVVIVRFARDAAGVPFVCRRAPDAKRPLEQRCVDFTVVSVCATCVRDCYSETIEDAIRRRLREPRA